MKRAGQTGLTGRPHGTDQEHSKTWRSITSINRTMAPRTTDSSNKTCFRRRVLDSKTWPRVMDTMAPREERPTRPDRVITKHIRTVNHNRLSPSNHYHPKCRGQDHQTTLMLPANSAQVPPLRNTTSLQHIRHRHMVQMTTTRKTANRLPHRPSRAP